MELEWFLLTLLVIAVIVAAHFVSKTFRLRGRVSKLEKQLNWNLTDFEKLQKIVAIYHDVNFKNLRPDQVKVFIDFWITSLPQLDDLCINPFEHVKVRYTCGSYESFSDCLVRDSRLGCLFCDSFEC